MGGEFGGEWIHAYVWLSHLALHLKLSQRCYSAILQYAVKVVFLKAFTDALIWHTASLVAQTSAYSVGDPGSIPGPGRSPGEGNGNPLQYSCLENPRDWGAWWATVHGVAESDTAERCHFHISSYDRQTFPPYFVWTSISPSCLCAMTSGKGSWLAWSMPGQVRSKVSSAEVFAL